LRIKKHSVIEREGKGKRRGEDGLKLLTRMGGSEILGGKGGEADMVERRSIRIVASKR